MQHYATDQQVFVALLVMARVASMVMTIPGIGDTTAPAPARLAFAVLLSLLLTPVVGPMLPPIPPDMGDLMGMVLKEVLVGLMLGAIMRAFLVSLATAGEIISIQTTLSFAQTANPSMGQETAVLTSFLSLLAVVLIMSTDLHHLFIAAIVRSYTLFPYGHPLPVQDAATLAVRTMSGAFALAVQLSAPLMVFSLIFNLATGLIGRAMPAFQIFFAAAPLQLLLGLSLFALSLGLMGTIWIDRYRDVLRVFV